MQFAAVFVEYLVTGVGAILWILPLLVVSLEELSGLQPGHVTLLVPLVYVTGMHLDVAASVLLQPVKRHARRRSLPWIRKTKSDPPFDGSRTAYVILHSPELGSAVQLRTSRDRIARGAWLNLALTAVVGFFRPKCLNALLPGPNLEQPFLSGTFVLLALSAFIGWWYAEYQTHRFKLEAVRVIESKLAGEAVEPDGA